MKDRTDKIGKIIISALMLLCVGIMLGACGNRGTEPQSQTAEETERKEAAQAAAPIDNPPPEGMDLVEEQNGLSKESDKSIAESGRLTGGEQISIKERGESVIRLIDEKLHSESYAKLIGVPSDILKSESYLKLKNCKYEKPEKVYRVTFSEAAAELFLNMNASDGFDLSSLSEELKESLRNQIQESWIAMLTGKMMGAKELAIQSFFAAEELFVDPSMAGQRYLLLYVYDDAYPVAVSFVGSKDGAIRARGNLVLIDDFPAGNINETEKSMTSFLGGMDEIKAALGILVEELE